MSGGTHSISAAPPETARPLSKPGAPTRSVVAGDSQPRGELGPRRGTPGAWLRRHGLLSQEAFVAYLASALSLAAYTFYTQRHETLAFGDAISHMSIARRVFGSYDPGLAQLGSVWPPLNHIFMLPLVWITPLYRDAFAGAFPSMVAYVVVAVYLYRTAHLLFASARGGWAAALLLMLNPNVLYMQATPMSELDLLCFAVVAVYYALRWARTLGAPDLVKSALATAAGTLVRYDGWALAGALLVTIAFVAWRRRGRLFAESNVLLYSTLAFAGGAAWLIYEQVIFGNALDFLNGPYSASAQQHRIQTGSGLPTYHNVLLSLHIYTQSVLDNISLPLCIAALAAVLWWALRTWRNLAALPAFAALVPLAFNCLALVLGITVMATPEILLEGHPGYLNLRYGMMMLPAVALFAALWAARSRLLLSVLLALALSFGFISTFQQMPYVLQDPLYGNRSIYDMTWNQADWLAAHYHGGEILIGSGPFTPMMFDTGLPEHDFISDSDGALFHAALKTPQHFATWVVIDPGSFNFDAVWAALHTRSDWHQDYALVTTLGGAQFYERIAPSSGASASTSPSPSTGMPIDTSTGTASSGSSGSSGSSAAPTAANTAGFRVGLAVSRALALYRDTQQATGGGA